MLLLITSPQGPPGITSQWFDERNVSCTNWPGTLLRTERVKGREGRKLLLKRCSPEPIGYQDTLLLTTACLYLFLIISLTEKQSLLFLEPVQRLLISSYCSQVFPQQYTVAGSLTCRSEDIRPRAVLLNKVGERCPEAHRYI